MSEEDKRRSIRERLSTIDHMYAGVQTEDVDRPSGKPWKRVLYDFRTKGSWQYDKIKSVPSTTLVFLLGVYLLLGYFMQVIEEDYATVVNEADLEPDNSITFSEETAWRYIRQILGDEPRVGGTPYHLAKTIELKNLVDSIAANSTLPIHTDWQMTSGDYSIKQAVPFVNCYQNTSNVIAVLEGDTGFNPDGTTGTSILVNCHYDSVPFALGVSDNMIFCGVMLETLTKLSRRQQKFKHNIVFLFNGAEESGLQASHGFLQHPWSKGVTNVINLDSAGINGKVFLFQVTDPRILHIYRKTTYKPNAQSLGELLFTAGVIPSDTDFRIFRDFGDFRGVDLAFIKGGHVYHTRYDNPDMVEPGVIQYAGNTVLNLVSITADEEALSTKIENSAAVYYDYLNGFMLAYSYTTAHIVDSCILVFGIGSVVYYVWLVGFDSESMIELTYSVLSRLLSMFAGLGISLMLIPIMIATTTQLRYLSHPWMIVPFFWLPYVVGAVAASQGFDAWRANKFGVNRSIRTVQAMAATRALLCTTLLILLFIPNFVTMRYLVSIPLFIMSMTSMISITVLKAVRLKGYQHLILEFFLCLPALLFLYSISLRINWLMLPVMGRNSADLPDYTVAFINLTFAILSCCAVAGLELLFSRKRLWWLLPPVLVVCFVIMLLPLSPYSDDGPAVQRHYWFHSDISSYDINGEITEHKSGVLVTKHDAYNVQSVLPVLKENNVNLNTRTDFSVDCERHIYCNLPLFRLRFGEFLPKSLLISMDPPNSFPNSIFLNEKNCVGETCTLNFTMTAPPHNVITLWPVEGVNLTSWSFDSPVGATGVFNNRPHYDIVHATNTYSEVLPVLEFGVTLNVPTSLQSQPIIEVQHHAHQIYHPDQFTNEYRNLLNIMPKYLNIATHLSFRKNYVF